MSMNGFKVVAAYHKGLPVTGIYRRKTGTFAEKKGIHSKTIDQYEYAFNFRVNGRTYRSMFGKESDYGEIGADGQWHSTAIDEAVKARLRFEENAINSEGPTSIKEEREAARKAAEKQKREEEGEKTVKQLMEEFLRHCGKSSPRVKTNKPRTIKEYRLNLERDVIPAIGDFKAKEIQKRHLVEIIDKIVDRKALVQANRTISACHRMFNYAVSKDIVPYNPCAKIEKFQEIPRDRTLTDKEDKNDSEKLPTHKQIKHLWLELMRLKDEYDEARVLLLCILFGSRPGEICDMRRSEIDDGWWSIHGDNTKTGIDLDCYITKTAKGIIGEAKGKACIFPLKTKDDKSFHVSRLSKFVRDNNYFGLEPWQPRDLRRTFTTIAKRFNNSDFIVNLAQARTDRSVIRTHYDQNKYYADLKKLFIDVEKEILRIVRNSD